VGEPLKHREPSRIGKVWQIMEEKKIVEEKTQKLLEMTGSFCRQYLDEDYKQLCEKLIGKMCRKRNVPFYPDGLKSGGSDYLMPIGKHQLSYSTLVSSLTPTGDDICNFSALPKARQRRKPN